MQFNLLCRKMRKYVPFFGNSWQMTGAWAEQTLCWVCLELLYRSKFWVKAEKTMLWRGEAASDIDKCSSSVITMSPVTNRHMQPARVSASPLRWPQFPTELRVYVYNRETPTRLWGRCGSRRRSSHILRFPVCCVLSPKPTLLFFGFLDGFSSLFLGGWVETLARP